MQQNSLVLTEDKINCDNPAYAAWQTLLAHVMQLKAEKRTEYIRYLPQHWRAVYTGFRLQNEINNGGDHQFFWNSAGALNRETLEDLRLISAGPFVLLFEEAIDEYERHDYRGEKTESGNSWEAFTKAHKERRLADLDEVFCKVQKTIAMHLCDFIRNNRSVYCHPAK